MATYEHRLAADGRLAAIRVKVRRAGMPHLSKTFAISRRAYPSATAAEAAARAWVDELEGTLAAPTSPARHEQASSKAAPWSRAPRPGAMGEFTRRASAPGLPGPRAASLVPGLPPPPTEAQWHAALAATAPGVPHGLVRFVLETGQPPDSLAAMRWQHVQLATRTWQVHAPAGPALRAVPLSPQALDALLSLPGRKYGLVFKLPAPAIQATLQHAASAAGLAPAALYLAAAWRLQAQGLSPAAVAQCMGLADLSVLGTAAPARSARPAALRRGMR